MDLPEGFPADQQERAYTAPIWYSPAKAVVIPRAALGHR